MVAAGGELGVNVYVADFNIDSLPVNTVYYAYIRTNFLALTFEAISEPIRLQTLWPDTLQFKYKNSRNVQDVAFNTGVQFSFRCEAGIMDVDFDYDGADYIDQIHNVEVLYGEPFRKYKLYIGDVKGVAPWVIDLLNRIFQCDYVFVVEDGLQYTKNTGAKWEINRVKGYPLIGGSLEIVESKNKSSLEFVNIGPPDPELIFLYDIDTDFFGQSSSDLHVIDYIP